MKSKRARATDIPMKVKRNVWERDEFRCIACGNRQAAPNAHYIPRSKGGLGIEENIVTLCLSCHEKMDNSTERKKMLSYVKKYLKSKYPEWDETKLRYGKWTKY